jgi:Protein of unknown function (DUF1493)
MLDRVRTLIAQESIVSLDKISAVSRLEEDLGITGNDHIEVLDVVFETLHIGVGDFSYTNYCSAEGLVLTGLSDFVRRIRRSGQAVRKPVTVAMLAQAALDGMWNSGRLDRLAIS